MMYVVLIEADDRIWLMLNEDSSVRAFTSQQEGLSFFEDSYNRNHGRSFEASMSACLNYLTFSPSIIEIQSEQDMVDQLVGAGPYQAMTLSSIAGSIYALECTLDTAQAIHAAGAKPSLINEETL
jgi:hypothetical protein